MDSDMSGAAYACLFYLLYREEQKLNKKRDYQRRRRALVKNRLKFGSFTTLYPKLRNSDYEFLNYYRITKKSFDDLLNIIKEDFGLDLVPGCVISPEEKLAITIRYMATGSIEELHHAYHLEKGTVVKIVEQVCTVLWEKLKATCIPRTTAKWEQIVEGFKRYANIPNCLGAIGTKHIAITQPPNSGFQYENAKCYFSIVLLALCDVNYRFTLIEVGSHGKFCNAMIYNTSSISKALGNRDSNRLNVPKPKPITSEDNTPLPYVLVGDKTYEPSPILMTPYNGKLTKKKEIFNTRLSRASRCVERAFSLMCNNWQVFMRPIEGGVTFATKVIMAGTLLHNYVQVHDGQLEVNTSNVCQSQDANSHNIQYENLSAVTVRDKFADYFINEGQLQGKDYMI